MAVQTQAQSPGRRPFLEPELTKRGQLTAVAGGAWGSGQKEWGD